MTIAIRLELLVDLVLCTYLYGDILLVSPIIAIWREAVLEICCSDWYIYNKQSMNYCTAVLVLLASNTPMKSGCVNSYSANANNKVV